MTAPATITEPRQRKAPRAGSPAAIGLERGLADLLADVVRQMEEDGAPAAEAARLTISRLTPDAEARDILLVDGLAHRANQYASRYYRNEYTEKDPTAVHRGKYQLRTPSGRAAEADLLRRVSYEGADGRYKTLMDFTMDDVRKLRASAQAHIVGYQRIDKAAGVIEAMLSKHKADTVADLPTAALERVRKAARGAWA